MRGIPSLWDGLIAMRIRELNRLIPLPLVLRTR